jgi:hypothetical protein
MCLRAGFGIAKRIGGILSTGHRPADMVYAGATAL